jgi:4-phytase/acid phosphatase
LDLGFGFGMPNPGKFPFEGFLVRFIVAVCLAALCRSSVARAEQDPAGDELKLAIIVTRHGVRSPLLANDALAKYASQPWPSWETAPGIQTPHGNQLIALMGDYYRMRFMRSGLLTGDPATDGPLVYIRADTDQRTKETGRILGKSLVPVGEPEVHVVPDGTFDPLFHSYRAHVGHPDNALAVAAVLGRMGGDTRNFERAYATQFAELKDILFGHGVTPPESAGFGAPTQVLPTQSQDYLVNVTGPLKTALTCIDAFILEYTDGKPAADVGWGKVDGKVLTDLMALHGFMFELTQGTFYSAQVNGSNLASHIVDTMEQAATGEPVPGALGPEGERIVVLAGHDTNVTNLGGLFGMNWWVPGTQVNPVLPGGALVFELWKRGGTQAAYYVRTTYVAQTLDQQRDATPLTLDAPPSLSPIFVPGCSGIGPYYDAPLASFVRQARKVIDPSFIAPEP